MHSVKYVPGLNSAGLPSIGPHGPNVAALLERFAQNNACFIQKVDLSFSANGQNFTTHLRNTARLLEGENDIVVTSSFGAWLALQHFCRQYSMGTRNLFKRLVIVAPFVTVKPVEASLPGWQKAIGRAIGFPRKGDDYAKGFWVGGKLVRQMLAPENDLFDGHLQCLRGQPIKVLAAPDAGYHTQVQVDMLRHALQPAVATLPKTFAGITDADISSLILQ